MVEHTKLQERFEAYRRLPAATPLDLDAWLREPTSYVDGTTHNFWNITNADLADFLDRNELPESVLPFHGGRLDRQGNRYYSVAAGNVTSYGPDNTPNFSGSENHPLGRPRDRYNDRLTRGDTGYPSNVFAADPSLPWPAGKPRMFHDGGLFGTGRGLDLHILEWVIEEGHEHLEREQRPPTTHRTTPRKQSWWSRWL